MRSSAAYHFDERQSRVDERPHAADPALTPQESSSITTKRTKGSHFGSKVMGRDEGDRYNECVYDKIASHKPPPQSSSHVGGRERGEGGYYESQSFQYPPPLPHHPYPMHSLAPRHLQSVVTTSFSLDDERDGSDRGMTGRRMIMERRSETAVLESRNDIYDNIGDHEQFNGAYDQRIPPSGHLMQPNHDSNLHHAHTKGQVFLHPRSGSRNCVNRSVSARSVAFNPLARPFIKRNYYHHSTSTELPDSNAGAKSQLPPDFMPPKRVKMKEAPDGEAFVTPRNPFKMNTELRQGESTWRGHGQAWESSYVGAPCDAVRERNIGRVNSFTPSQSWSDNQHSPLGYHGSEKHTRYYAHVSPGQDEKNITCGTWKHPRSSLLGWGSPPKQPQVSPYRYWDSPDPSRHQGSPYARWESRSDREQAGYHHQRLEDVSMREPPPYFHPENNLDKDHIGTSRDNSEMQVEGAENSIDHQQYQGHDSCKSEGVQLLAMPQDRVALSETLCVVRENIEVFIANQADVDAPAPGRKHAVVVGQVGLRCIHCRHTVKASDRVKRAVCYPSSIKRIYRTVIDMKLDHFSQCKFVPTSLKCRLQQLKTVQTRSTGTTMQYFIRAAKSLGMVDGISGVRLLDSNDQNDGTMEMSSPERIVPVEPESSIPEEKASIIQRTGSDSTQVTTAESEISRRNDSMMSTVSFDSTSSPENIVSLEKYFEGCIPLSLPEDVTSLSPLRCFLREQICAFSATDEDITERAPTTLAITKGQVGIGCIHCLKHSPKYRSNRAVCFPFAVGRIYQSVADIQRFHFTECKMIPPDLKDKFDDLQKASSKGSKGLATRQYWVTSAKKLGLVDTQRGIRFGRDPLAPEESKAFSLDILAAAAFSVTTANRQLVVEEDKDKIAEFLFVVMEQLQPCRFTEADRNKRRLKDVGCIGVECKHCAGQIDGRKFFWSSVSAVESNFVSVHTHMLECKMVPQEIKERLIELKSLRKQQTAALKSGSQKAFFCRVWKRLHDENERVEAASRQGDNNIIVHPIALNKSRSYDSMTNYGAGSFELTRLSSETTTSEIAKNVSIEQNPFSLPQEVAVNQEYNRDLEKSNTEEVGKLMVSV